MTAIIKSEKIRNFLVEIRQTESTYQVTLSHQCGDEDYYRVDKTSTFTDLKKATNRYNALAKAVR